MLTSGITKRKTDLFLLRIYVTQITLHVGMAASMTHLHQYILYMLLYLLDWKRDSAEKGLGLAAGGRLKGLAVAAEGGSGGANIGGGNGCVVGCRG
jgi:hypothetical protein